MRHDMSLKDTFEENDMMSKEKQPSTSLYLLWVIINWSIWVRQDLFVTRLTCRWVHVTVLFCSQAPKDWNFFELCWHNSNCSAVMKVKAWCTEHLHWNPVAVKRIHNGKLQTVFWCTWTDKLSTLSVFFELLALFPGCSWTGASLILKGAKLVGAPVSRAHHFMEKPGMSCILLVMLPWVRPWEALQQAANVVTRGGDISQITLLQGYFMTLITRIL